MTEDSVVRVTVVIPTLNGAQHLRSCLSSLENQSYNPTEVIVVDNGSTDSTIDILKTEFPYVHIIQLSRNHGFAGAVNAGINAASGDYVALLNNDAVADQHWLRNLMATIKRDEKIGVCGSKLLQRRAESGHYYIDSTGESLSVWGVAIPRGRDELDTSQYDTPEEIFSVSAGAALYRRHMLMELESFDEDFFAYYEDVDLCFRARHRGWKVWYCPDAVVYHALGATSGGRDAAFTRYHCIRNAWYVWIKNLPARLVVKYLPELIVGQVLLLINSARRGLLIPHLRALYSVARNYSRMLKKRRAILAQSCMRLNEIDAWLSKSMMKAIAPSMRRSRRRH
jgi:GT2 family glycosyltransferase